jgi:hypothetical protein
LPKDWIVDGRRVGQVTDSGSFWLDDATDFDLVREQPLPGETAQRTLLFGEVVGGGGFVIRGLPV